ncbi:hypothetical protein BpHYR1_009162 [Brachionus plicatilis]|uniref:Uncharacterized protein n=1 Tax=Brachionus plicatilis TaxID=10195 RepID=A0A3M7PFT9_BRAPC|nr:hypothetical protein BpHYR1_009162 [Brachionus plicatilis]
MHVASRHFSVVALFCSHMLCGQCHQQLTELDSHSLCPLCWGIEITNCLHTVFEIPILNHSIAGSRDPWEIQLKI